jgi:titin
VAAVNAVGASEPSVASAPIRAASVPQTPGQPAILLQETTQITIGWQEPIFDGGSPLLHYLVYIATSGNDYQLYAATTDGLVTQMLVAGLENGEMYYFKVTAVNLVGESSDSSPSSALAAVKPAAPATPSLVLQTSTLISFSWFEPANGGANIDDYQVFVCQHE